MDKINQIQSDKTADAIILSLTNNHNPDEQAYIISKVFAELHTMYGSKIADTMKVLESADQMYRAFLEGINLPEITEPMKKEE